MGKTYQMVPKRGAPRTVHFYIKGKIPTAVEVGELGKIPFRKRPISGAEISESLKMTFLGLVFAIAAWFFGQWVIGNFRGPGVLFFGYGAAYIGAPALLVFMVVSFAGLFSSGRKRKPENSLKWIWQKSFLGGDVTDIRAGKMSYALGTIERVLPADMPFDSKAMEKYIGELRSTLIAAMDETSQLAKEDHSGGWKEGESNMNFCIVSKAEIMPGAMEVCATIDYQDVLTRTEGDNTGKMVGAILTLHISSVFIKTGHYWFPYDLTPEFQRRE